MDASSDDGAPVGPIALQTLRRARRASVVWGQREAPRRRASVTLCRVDQRR